MEAMPPLLPHRDDWKAAEICIETCDFRCGCRHMASTRRVAELLALSGRYPLYLPLTCCSHTHTHSSRHRLSRPLSTCSVLSHSMRMKTIRDDLVPVSCLSCCCCTRSLCCLLPSLASITHPLRPSFLYQPPATVAICRFFSHISN